MKTVAVVPMKLNSSRLKNKNIKSFTNGLPLCSYILNTLNEISSIDEIYVYCSDSKIVDYLPKGVKYLKRSSSLDTDDTKINEVLYSFYKEVPADIYVLAHTTSPFIKSTSIEKGLSLVLSGEYDSAFSVKKMQDFFWKDNKPINYDLSCVPRTQDLDPFYMETSGFYIYKKNIIKNKKSRIGDNPYLVEVSQIESIDIDEEEDFFIADSIFNHQKDKEMK